MGDHPTGPLADALMSCGMKPEDVKVEWDDLCREYVLTFAAAGIPDAVLLDLADLHLSFPSRFVFASEELDDAFRRLVSASPRMVALRDQASRQQHEWLAARGLSGFPPFDPENETVSEFAARVEMACGAGRGDLLSMKGNDALWVNPLEPGTLTPERIQTLMALLQTRAPNLPCSITGQDTGGVR